jgi:hypothetical protein
VKDSKEKPKIFDRIQDQEPPTRKKLKVDQTHPAGDPTNPPSNMELEQKEEQ